jgi:hypothetical protein
MSDKAVALPRSQSAEVIEYEYSRDNMRVPAPSLPQAITQFHRAVEDLSVMDDVILEYERDRYGQIKFRFRCYKHR